VQISEDDKAYITALLESGDKLGAVRHIQQTLSLSAEDALTLAERLEEQNFDKKIASLEQGVNPASLVGTVFTVVGFILLSLAFIFGFQDYKFATSAIPLMGKVTRIDNNGSMYVPVVSYELFGVPHEYTGTVSTSSPAFSVGEEVELLVNANDPADAKLNSFLDRWFVVTLLGGMGLLFSTIGYFVRRIVTPR